MDEHEDSVENLTEIDASGKFMWGQPTFTFLSKLAQPDQIVSLDLTTNHISKESAELLTKLLLNSKNLKYLSIIQTKIVQTSSVLLFSAIGDSQLLEFYADDNIFQAEPCKALGESLKKNPPLELLSLNGCDISDEGIIFIAQSLPSNNHLLHLRLESNSMFNYGAQKIGEVLPNTSLVTLSVSDNQIWTEGTSSIIANMQKSHLESLDLSYNVVDLALLAKELEVSRISSLAISGCKVSENQLINFLQRIPNYGLTTLIIDGLNFQVLPISWPKVEDTLWQNHLYFDAIKSSLNSPTITDFRIGYFDLEQIFIINKVLESRQNELIISLQNFGKTKDIWLFKLPGPHFESPTDVFRWNGNIDESNCQFIGQIVCQTKIVEDGKDDRLIKTIDFHRLELKDDVVGLIVSSLKDFPIKNLNFSENDISDISLKYFADYINLIKLESLDLGDTDTTDAGVSDFLMSIRNPAIFPKRISLSFKSSDHNELSLHQVSRTISEIIKDNNFEIEYLSLSGPITATDAIEIVSSFPSNSHLREVHFISDHANRYNNPDPDLNEDVQTKFIEFTDVLYKAICEEGSLCQVKKFIFPLFTEIYLYRDEIYDKWIEIDEKLTYNNN